MIKKKILNIIVVGTISVIALTTAGIVTLKSFIDYQKYYKENYVEPDPTDKATLIDLRAELKPGVQYYKNNLANPIDTDLIVTGTYQPKEEGQPSFEYVLDPIKKPYKVTTDPRFAFDGGDIIVTYGNFSTVIKNVQLQDVELVDIEIERQPYIIKYQVGQVFNTTGMIVNAIYNDNERVEIKNNEYNISKTTALDTSDKVITIYYSKGKTTKSKDIKISVVKKLDDGMVKSISPVDNYYPVRDGKQINTTPIKILAKYASGNSYVISKDKYSIISENYIANFGREYALTAIYNENNKIKTDVPLKVLDKIEGESGEIVGGSIKTEDEYIINNGQLVLAGTTMFVGDFGKTVTSGGKASVTWNITSYTKNNADITMRCANSNLAKDGDNYFMKPLQINSIADLLVNGEKVDIPNNVVLAGCGPYESFGPLYNIYSEFTFKNVNLIPGNNTITISFKKSTLGELNYWDESPSTMNIDTLSIVSSGHTPSTRAKVIKLDFDEKFNITYGMNLNNLSPRVFAKYNDGDEEIIDNSLLNITKPSGYADIGNITVTIELKSNASVSTSKTFTIDPLILEAENAVKSGSNKVVDSTEDEFDINHEPYRTATVVKGMDNSATNYDGETSLSFTFNGAKGQHNLIVRCDNAYYFDNGDGTYSTGNINLEQTVEIYVNDTKINFSIAIPTVSNVTNPDVCWMSLFELNLGKISIKDGENNIKIVSKKDAPKNSWNECSIPRFDYIKLI